MSYVFKLAEALSSLASCCLMRQKCEALLTGVQRSNACRPRADQVVLGAQRCLPGAQHTTACALSHRPPPLRASFVSRTVLFRRRAQSSSRGRGGGGRVILAHVHPVHTHAGTSARYLKAAILLSQSCYPAISKLLSQLVNWPRELAS